MPPNENRPGAAAGAVEVEARHGVDVRRVPRGSDTELSVASDVRRRRRSPEQMREFRAAIFNIVAEHQPCSGRQVYYRAVVAGLVDKDTAGSRANEKKVGDALNHMREAYVDHTASPAPGLAHPVEVGEEACRRLGIMPFEWITDDTRVRYHSTTYSDRDAALRHFHAGYRRNLWQSQPRHVEVWCESGSLASVLLDVTDGYGVDLLPCRGQAGKRFVWDSARSYAYAGKPVTCLYVGDFDPAGLDIGASVETRLQRYLRGVNADIEFRRIAIAAEQVRDLGLPGHGVNPNVPRSQRGRFFDMCDEYGIPREAVEAEAMSPALLRQLVDEAIAGYVDARQWNLEIEVEDNERRSILDMIGGG